MLFRSIQEVDDLLNTRLAQAFKAYTGALDQLLGWQTRAATALAAPETDPSQLVATADSALYRAKHMGRNRISLPGGQTTGI